MSAKRDEQHEVLIEGSMPADDVGPVRKPEIVDAVDSAMAVSVPADSQPPQKNHQPGCVLEI